MNTVGETIQHVSTQLSDQRGAHAYTRWRREHLLEYLNQGLKEIGAYRPDAFAKTYRIDLVPGRKQSAPNGDAVQSVSLGNGKDSMAHKSSSELLKSFSAYHDAPTPLRTINGVIQYKVRSISRDKTDQSIFYVSPPVPAGAKASLEIQVNSRPPEYSGDYWDKPVGIEDKYYNNLIDFILARAYAKDTESQVSAAKSQRLLQLFYQAMGAKYKIDSARNSGYYLGDVGTGDPRSMT